MQPVILIPARMNSTRLPGKPLLPVGDAPMIVQVWRRVMEAKLGDVIIACDGEAIADAVRAAGGQAIVTDPDLPSGSDRIWQALNRIEGGEKYDVVVNVQGDMPTLDPAIIQRAVALLANPEVAIGTLAAVITDEAEKHDPAVVKPVLAGTPSDAARRALYFSRQAVPHGDGPLYHHIGIYAYRREALARFVGAPESPLERREKLEQLRALELGMRIEVAVVDMVPLGVDTPETLEKARNWYGKK